MGLLAIGIKALGNSRGFVVNVLNDAPGPHRINAWKPGEGIATACGIPMDCYRTATVEFGQ